MSDDSSEFAGTARFQLVRMLGEGGMGVVYEALDTDRNQRVALKTLRAFTADSLFRFKREFRALQTLHHPNLVNLGELIEERGQWFFTMELVDGVNFVKYVRGEDWQMRQSFEASRILTPVPPPSVQLDIAPTAETDELTMQELIDRSHKIVYTGEGTLDELKLRVALAQLAEGLGALHRAGKVHRDVKPSNVLVTEEGRVVLLDFGLVAEMEDSHERRVVGTVDYMAPEQALGTQPGPAADWYSVGALIYEAIAGRPPFIGPSMEVLMGKQRYDAVPPSRHDPTVPQYLDELCMALLQRDPSRRISEREILKRIGLGPATPAVEPVAQQMESRSQRAPFIGRQVELALLHAAFAECHDGNTVTVHVLGEAGIGRTAFLDQFVDELREHAPDAVVLSGRCQEYETVPFKAFDGVIDSLCRYLLRLPREEVVALLPEHASSAAHLFPVLSRIEAVAALGPAATALDLPSLRARGFDALRDLLARLSAKKTVVICIDDYHWADADSQALRQEVLGEKGPPLLIVKTLRPDADHPFASTSHARRIALERLGVAESRGLVALLLKSGGIALEQRDTEWIDALADEAHGHPLFIDQLVRYALETGERGARAVGLGAAIWSRICRLDEPLRRIVEFLAVARRPLAQEAAAAAAGLEYAEFSRLSNVLRVAHLVRTSGARRGDTIEPYHEKVRQAVLAHLPAGEAARIATFLPPEKS